MSTLAPGAAPEWLRNASIPGALTDAPGEVLARRDIRLHAGRIAELRLSGPDQPAVAGPDLGGRMVWPGLVDCHTHLDKGHIWPRAPNPTGSFEDALGATARDRTRHWTRADVARRMDFALAAAHAHGTVALRTHLDTEPERLDDIWGAYLDVEAAWRGRLTLRPAALLGTPDIEDRVFMARVTAYLTAIPGAVLGAFVRGNPEDREAVTRHLRAFCELAGQIGCALDFHVDETTDPTSSGLDMVAEAVIDTGFDGPVLCGHGCALAGYDANRLAATLERARRARLSLVSLPLCNSYLQDRVPGRTPRLRGTAPVHEIAAAGIPVALGSDNTRDPFHAYGDLDLIETYRVATLIQHLDHPVGAWPMAVTRTPAVLMGLEDRGRIAPGLPADLVILEARSFDELGARPQSDRVVLRAGRVIPKALPAYADAELALA